MKKYQKTLDMILTQAPDESNRIYLSDYCMVQINSTHSDADTVILFSPLNTKPGKFRFTKAFQEFSGNCIFVKCENDWYINGIPGLGDTYLEAVETLTKIVETISGTNGKVITVGGSMGGYGALLYGSLMNASYSFCSGVELIMVLPKSRSKLCENTISPVELKQIIKDSTCRHHLCLGENDQVDMLCYSYFYDMEEISWNVFKNKPHKVIIYIHQKYGIHNLVNQLLLRGKIELEASDLTRQPLEHKKVLNLYIKSLMSPVLNHLGDIDWQSEKTDLTETLKLLYYIEAYQRVIGLCEKNHDILQDKGKYFFLMSLYRLKRFERTRKVFEDINNKKQPPFMLNDKQRIKTELFHFKKDR